MIAVIDSGVANLASVMAALGRLGAEAEVTLDPKKIRLADRIILPGVGAAAAAMAKLRERGLIESLRAFKNPVLGICLGMQIFFTRSFEGGTPVAGLDILKGDVRALPASPETPVPHMGWNQLSPVKPDLPLLAGLDPRDYVYFVHSYAAEVSETTLATAFYGKSFAAVCGFGNFFGCQFHPERSGKIGAKLLANFMKL